MFYRTGISLAALLVLIFTAGCGPDIHEAVFKNDLGMAKAALLKDKVDVNGKTADGAPMLVHASFKNSMEICSLLLEKGANVNIANRYQVTSLHWASRFGYTELVRLLLKYHADVDARNSNGETPLHLACFCGHADLAQLLIDNKADIKAITKDGLTPLHQAASSGNLKLVMLLISRGADVNALTRDHWTPLHFAARDDRYYIVEYLIATGAQDGIETSKGKWTPYKLAEENNNKLILPLLHKL